MGISASVGGQASVRARSRPQNGQGGQRAPQNYGGTADWMKSGAAAVDGHRQHQEVVSQRREERSAEYGVPFRHWLAKGEAVDAVILDNDFGPGILEHDLTMNERFQRRNPRTGRPMDQFVSSPEQCGEVDPIKRETGKDPYYATYLTIGILRPWQDNKGVTHSYSRRLLPLKGDAMDAMAMIRDQQIRAGNHDNPLRGVQVVLRRGNGDQSLRTGIPHFVERHSEKDIMETFGNPEVRGEQDGKVLKLAGEDAYPIDYARAFPKPSAEAICRRFNLQPPATPGSRGYTRGAFDDGSDREGTGYGNDDDGASDNGWQGGSFAPQGGAAGSGQGNGFAADLDDDVPF